MFLEFIVYIIAGLGAGIGTGLAGLSAAAVISPMLITFLGFPAYEAVGIALASDVLASAASAYTYGKNKNIDIPIYVSCGTEDLLYEQSTKFVECNPQLKIKFISEPGDHEWKLWNLNLARFMEEINKSLV